LMFGLQVLAWQADVTRVRTLLAKELSNAVHTESGVRDALTFYRTIPISPRPSTSLPC
jgi:hypothetical protein